MNENNSTEANNDGIGDSTDFQPGWSDAAYAAALAYDCGIEGCDHVVHDETDTPDQWYHRLLHIEFSEGEVALSLNRDRFAHHTANIWLAGEDNDMSPAELRAKADLYESVPGAMRAAADRLEALIASEPVSA